MQVTSWPNNVNKKILSETSITIGEGGFIEDQESNGWQERRLTSMATPDSFQVVMDFDWGGEDPIYPEINGKTEYDRFIKWYKFIHKRGTNPFWFPCITKHPVNNIYDTDKSEMCLYKITSTLNVQTSGLSQRVTMTWKEVYSGTINIQNPMAMLDHVVPFPDRMEVIFSNEPENEPVFSDFSLSFNDGNGWNSKKILSMEGKGKTFILRYEDFPDGKYFLRLSYKEQTAPEVTLNV